MFSSLAVVAGRPVVAVARVACCLRLLRSYRLARTPLLSVRAVRREPTEYQAVWLASSLLAVGLGVPVMVRLAALAAVAVTRLVALVLLGWATMEALVRVRLTTPPVVVAVRVL
jgi:hypothetical protein